MGFSVTLFCVWVRPVEAGDTGRLPTLRRIRQKVPARLADLHWSRLWGFSYGFSHFIPLRAETKEI